MLSVKQFVIYLSLNTIVSCLTERQDVHQMMYRTFDGAPACFRRLNGTHQFGCSSPRSGSYGVVHFIRNDSQLMEFLRNAVAGPYAVILSPRLFRENVTDSLIGSGKVSGIILNIAETPDLDSPPEFFSPDDSCPNRYSSLNNTCDVDWNLAANHFLFRDWPLPVFLLNKPNFYQPISDCYDLFNPPLDSSQLSRPLCSLHLKSHMHAAVNSETCLRRINYYGVNAAKYCDPVGDENVVLPSLPWQENDTRNVIVVGARLDAISMFDGIAPGAMSSAAGFVTLMTAAYIFHKMIEEHDFSKLNNDVGIVFMLFNGDANDYIGSSRIVYDMNQGVFPSRYTKLHIQNIKLFLEISQLSSSSDVFVHHTQHREAKDFIDQLKNSTGDIVFKSSSLLKELPPASYQSFAKVNTNIPGVILTNFDKQFVNKFYHSVFDTAKYLGYKYANGSSMEKSAMYALQNRLATIAEALATFLYKKAFNGTEPPAQNKSAALVDELLHCYIQTRRCRLMTEVGAIASDKLPDLPSLYVGVRNNPENYLARVTGYIIAYLTGNKLPQITRENCVNDETQRDYSYFWISGLCINSSVLFTPAESPAFIIENYDWKSGLYSTWTESVWGQTTLTMFVKPARKQEIVVLCTGLIVLFMSFTTVYWFDKKSSVLFVSTTPTRC